MENKVENKNANQINFDYNGKHYCLEYTRESVKQMEAAGFNMNDMGDKPATRIEQLWQGAFLANHKKTSLNIVRSMYDEMSDKENLMQTLATMYANTLNYLMPDEDDNQGNVKWTASL